jgi:hypothetical protein
LGRSDQFGSLDHAGPVGHEIGILAHLGARNGGPDAPAPAFAFHAAHPVDTLDINDTVRIRHIRAHPHQKIRPTREDLALGMICQKLNCIVQRRWGYVLHKVVHRSLIARPPKDISPAEVN